jgi:magnesium transporter
MIATSFELNDSLRLVPSDPEKAVEACQTGDTKVWLDLQGFEPSELEAWLDRLAVRDLARRLCLEGSDRSGFYPLESELFLVVAVPTDTAVMREVDYLAFLCRDNLLLTLHRNPVLSLQQFAESLVSDAWLRTQTIAGLLSAMMIDLSQQSLHYVADLRKSVIVLEEMMDRDPDSVEADEILDLRSAVLALGTVVSDQLPSLRALGSIDKPFFRLEDAEDYMNCALVNLQAADSATDWLDGRISALRSGFQMHAQDKTNDRLNMLTILSAVFNPASLLAAIWGMNFMGMSELKLPYGYPLALGLMVLSGLAVYAAFRKKGCID